MATTPTSHGHNTTTIPFNDIKQQTAMQIGIIAVNLISAVTILTGNGLVITAVAKFSSLRSNMFLFMCSLSVADSLVGIALFTHTIYNLVNAFDSSDFILCSFTHILIITSIYCTLLNMTCIAVDRSLAINRPLHYNQYMSPRNVTALLIVIWIFSITAGLGLLMGRTEWRISTCNYQELYQPGYKLFAICYVYIMMVVIVILYGQLFLIAHRQQNKIFAETTAADQASWMKSNYKAVKMFLVVVGSILICWTPLTLVVTIMFVDISLMNRTALLITHAFACSNSILNPIIYAFKNSKMRKAFKELLHLPECSSGMQDGAGANQNTSET